MGVSEIAKSLCQGPGVFRPEGCGANRRLRLRARTTVTASRCSAAFRAQDGWRRQGRGRWKGQGCRIARLSHGSAETTKHLEAYSWGARNNEPLVRAQLPAAVNNPKSVMTRESAASSTSGSLPAKHS